ncbi:MAG: hypothetical protein GY795_30985 [Desulfobacterales bacterium]|nr:hypothetical protein [Desulfobacterales bacterium]
MNKVETEGKGLDYERYALGRFFDRLVKTYHIRSVLEIPSKGEKAMPSIYSLGLSAAGCDVSLVNPEEKSKKAWDDLGFNAEFLHCRDLTGTGIDSSKFDLVWNFMYLARVENDALLKEMARLSRKYVLYIGVNRYNPGFFSHRLVHRIFDIPWNHGTIKFMNLFYVSEYFKNHGLKIIKTGVVDAPPYPDSLGIRDMRLHRMNIDLNKADWESRTINWMKTGKYPLKIKLFYLYEIFPLPFFIKLLQGHLFYVLGEKISIC